MDGECALSARARKRDARNTPNLSKSLAKDDTISAAAVFTGQKPDTKQLQHNSHTPRRLIVKRTAKKTAIEEVHSLALAFKESSEDYRRHLYLEELANINKLVSTFHGKMYESNLQVTSSESANTDSQASPLKLTMSAKYQRCVEKLYHTLSGHRYSPRGATSSSEVERIQATVHDRFRSFEKTMSAEMAEIKNLQIQWESVVAEIFQLGMACLGQEDIAFLLANSELEAGEAESTPFDLEQTNSAHSVMGKRKRGSFAGANMAKVFPGFLFQAPTNQREPVPASPQLPADEVLQLEQVIVDLGKQHVTDLQRLEKDHLTWWKKKQTQIQRAFAQD